jgi:hypothetical protein
MFGHKGGDCCQPSCGCDGCGAQGAYPAPVAQPAPGQVIVPPAHLPPGRGPTSYAPPSYQPNYVGAPVVVNPPQAGGQVNTLLPNQGGNVTNPQPLPQGKPAEPIQKQPNQEKNTKQNSGTSEGARAMPPAPVVQPAAAKVETEVKNPFEVDRRYDKRVTHAADYSKLTGQLYYVHADGGLWVLRYASLDVEDARGGNVILARDRQMNNYREGDLVTVEGEVISDKGSSRLGGPLYRVRNIVLVDRPQ